ncbi:MAG TPA: Rid family hydrolase [Saprospiraceae bacterium]|nr:Rid family hydrolase [Saprospiraceae bacterium]HMP22947.1 Rid family hydrolase [Saprospiraceae bacterium]
MKSRLVLSLLSLIALAGCTSREAESDTFQKEFIHPLNGYSQVVAVTQGKVKTLYISGQIGEGPDLEAQLRAVFNSLQNELNAGGAAFKDLVKINTYIVDYKAADLELFRNVRKEILGENDLPASTLVGVSALARPEWRIEMEAVAVVKMK